MLDEYKTWNLAFSGTKPLIEISVERSRDSSRLTQNKVSVSFASFSGHNVEIWHVWNFRPPAYSIMYIVCSSLSNHVHRLCCVRIRIH